MNQYVLALDFLNSYDCVFQTAKYQKKHNKDWLVTFPTNSVLPCSIKVQVMIEMLISKFLSWNESIIVAVVKQTNIYSSSCLSLLKTQENFVYTDFFVGTVLASKRKAREESSISSKSARHSTSRVSFEWGIDEL